MPQPDSTEDSNQKYFLSIIETTISNAFEGECDAFHYYTRLSYTSRILGRDNNRWPLSVLIYQGTLSAIRQLLVRTQESDYDKLPVSEITLRLAENLRPGREQEACEHNIGEPLNELETRCCAWKGQRVMDLTAMMRKDAFPMQRCCV